MNPQEIVFYILSSLTILCAAGVIFSRSPINSILFLILTFFCISGHYIMMNAQFLAIVNIIVYAGAIMVLFLFVVMLMNLNSDTEPQKSMVVQVSAVLSGGILLTVIIAAFKTYSIQLTTGHALNGQTDIGLIKNLGVILFKEYALPFEISSVLFLSAMVGAVIIGKK
ncbi:MAG: NADH-quinone oxidoreductase subunit J [Chitinophagaceae bacterium]|nr:NADH-quinone oxidoreductase subunit J [Chitinophagaceae bacterium]